MSGKKIEDDSMVLAAAEDFIKQCLARGLSAQQAVEATFAAMISVGCVSGAWKTKDDFLRWLHNSVEDSWVNMDDMEAV